jgi:SET domain-containing protein
MSVKVVPTLHGKGNCLVSLNYIKVGKVLHKISEYEIITAPTRTSIQISRHESIEECSHIAHMNHSCDPNVLIDISRMELRSIRDIAPGEELTFFYPSTEPN